MFKTAAAIIVAAAIAMSQLNMEIKLNSSSVQQHIAQNKKALQYK